MWRLRCQTKMKDLAREYENLQASYEQLAARVKPLIEENEKLRMEVAGLRLFAEGLRQSQRDYPVQVENLVAKVFDLEMQLAAKV